MTYAEKLKDPRWQKRRLSVLEKANFECDNCGNGDEELSVHHKFYKKGSDPWEYDDDDYLVFCKTCHESWHKSKLALDKAIGEMLTSEQLERLTGYALAIAQDVFPKQLSSPDSVLGYADYFRTNKSVVIYMIKKAAGERGPLSPTPLLSRQIEE